MAITDDTGIVQDQVEPKDAIVRQARREAEPEAKGDGLNAGSVFRLIILIAIVVFLGFYRRSRRDGRRRSSRSSSPSACRRSLFVGANLLFDQVYDRWTLFNTIVGAVTGVRRATSSSRATGLLRPLFDNRVNVLGVGPVRHQRLAVGAHRRRRPRARHVPAQRAPPATGPACRWRSSASPPSAS